MLRPASNLRPSSIRPRASSSSNPKLRTPIMEARAIMVDWFIPAIMDERVHNEMIRTEVAATQIISMRILCSCFFRWLFSSPNQFLTVKTSCRMVHC